MRLTLRILGITLLMLVVLHLLAANRLIGPKRFREEHLGKPYAEIVARMGHPPCKEMDSLAFFWGISVRGFNLVGLSLSLGFSDDPATGEPVIITQDEDLDLLGFTDPCGYWAIEV